MKKYRWEVCSLLAVCWKTLIKIGKGRNFDVQEEDINERIKKTFPLMFFIQFHKTYKTRNFYYFIKSWVFHIFFMVFVVKNHSMFCYFCFCVCSVLLDLIFYVMLPDLSQFYKLYYCMVLWMLEPVTTFCLMMIRHDEKKESWCRVNVLGQLKCFVICYLMENLFFFFDNCFRLSNYALYIPVEPLSGYFVCYLFHSN